MKTNPTYMNKKVKTCRGCRALNIESTQGNGSFYVKWTRCEMGYPLHHGREKTFPLSGECPKPMTIAKFNEIKSIQESTVGKK